MIQEGTIHKININHVIPGMKLARAIYSQDGGIVLTSGVELKDIDLERLIASDITELYIYDDISKNIDIEESICIETKKEINIIVKNFISRHVESSSINLNKVKANVHSMLEEILLNRDIIVNLSDIKSVDDYTFEHSINVCVLSLITGIGLGYNMLRLKDLGIGAILHDIGKLRVSQEILKKPSRLTMEEFEEIKRHTLFGYDILKNSKGVSTVAAFIAIGHHERYDGSGYPLQIRGENIHQCARIVAVADVYDALTSDRVYRKKMDIHEVIEYITSLGSRHFDKEIVDSFMKFMKVQSRADEGY